STLARMRDTFGTLPFLATDEGHIADAIAAMMDPPTRALWGARGYAHAARWHDGAETVARLEPIYRTLADGAGASRSPAPPTGIGAASSVSGCSRKSTYAAYAGAPSTRPSPPSLGSTGLSARATRARGASRTP